MSLPAPGALATAPRDQPGAETLEIMAAARRYSIWQYRRLDTVIALNVIEHIEEDVAAMRSMRNMLVRVLRLEDAFPLPFGQSLIAVGVRDA